MRTFLEALQASELKDFFQYIYTNPSDSNFLILADRFDESGESSIADFIRILIGSKRDKSLKSKLEELLNGNHWLWSLYHGGSNQVGGWIWNKINNSDDKYYLHFIRQDEGLTKNIEFYGSIYYFGYANREYYNIKGKRLSGYVDVYSRKGRITVHDLPDEIVLTALLLFIIRKVRHGRN